MNNFVAIFNPQSTDFYLPSPSFLFTHLPSQVTHNVLFDREGLMGEKGSPFWQKMTNPTPPQPPDTISISTPECVTLNHLIFFFKKKWGGGGNISFWLHFNLKLHQRADLFQKDTKMDQILTSGVLALNSGNFP